MTIRLYFEKKYHQHSLKSFLNTDRSALVSSSSYELGIDFLLRLLAVNLHYAKCTKCFYA